jgi:tetratricopeptide (TPR) repeat protein
MSVQIFLSTVSDEFRAYRDQLRRDLTRHNVEVKIQEDFKDYGGVTLDKLDLYIAECDAVVHLAGDMTGAHAKPASTQAILAKYPDLPSKVAPLRHPLEQGLEISYTQWEAWLALYHDKPLLIAKADVSAPRGPNYAPTDASRASQNTHLELLRVAERYPGCRFTSPDNLTKYILSSVILDLLAKEFGRAPPRRPRNLPYTSLGPLFKGRDSFLMSLHAKLHPPKDEKPTAVVGRALHGLGGVGKTRLAVEYALRHADQYSALLFISAESPEQLNTGLAALTATDALDLPEKDAPKDEDKVKAALRWLDDNLGWLLILDNVDDGTAASAVERLLSKLRGGYVLITGRMTNFSAAVDTLPLDVLDADDAADFLLERTKGKRAVAPDDPDKARELARDLGGLALGLEQAGAYISTQHIAFGRYLTLWREKREKVLSWFDPGLMAYNHDVGLATTWATSVDKLTPSCHRLLERLAFLAPEPIPDLLLDTVVPGDPADFDARAAMTDLCAYSLAAPLQRDDNASEAAYVVHRLVQDFARQRIEGARQQEALQTALNWVGTAFNYDPQDAGNWRRLDPIAPHAYALSLYSNVIDPGLLGRIGGLHRAKARYGDAEPLLRRAVVISEERYGPNDIRITDALSDLAVLLQDTNRIDEAEPLFRRSLAIAEKCHGLDHPALVPHLSNLGVLLRKRQCYDEAERLLRLVLDIAEESYSPDDPQVAKALNNFAQLLRATNRSSEAVPLSRRALTIQEKKYGPDHHNVAAYLGNLAWLLSETDQIAEAKGLFRRALKIDEKTYGPDHPNVAMRLNNLAGLFLKAKRFDKAEELFRRALVILVHQQEVDSRPHPDLKSAINNYTGVLMAMGKSDREAFFMLWAVVEEADVTSCVIPALGLASPLESPAPSDGT